MLSPAFCPGVSGHLGERRSRPLPVRKKNRQVTEILREGTTEHRAVGIGREKSLYLSCRLLWRGEILDSFNYPMGTKFDEEIGHRFRRFMRNLYGETKPTLPGGAGV
jgi:hypothetical protein